MNTFSDQDPAWNYSTTSRTFSSDRNRQGVYYSNSIYKIGNYHIPLVSYRILNMLEYDQVADPRYSWSKDVHRYPHKHVCESTHSITIC